MKKARILSLLLSAALVVTSVPMVVMPVSAADTVASADLNATANWSGVEAVTPDANTYVHVGTQDTNVATGYTIQTGCTFEVGTQYLLILKGRTDDRMTLNNQIFIEGIGENGANVRFIGSNIVGGEGWVDIGEWNSEGDYTAITFTPVTEGSGAISFRGNSSHDKCGYDIDDLVIAAVREEGEEIVFSTSSKFSDGDYYKEWTEVTVGSPAVVLTECDYLQSTAEADAAGTVTATYNNSIAVAAGTYAITGAFRVPTATVDKFVNLAESGKLLRDYNGADITAKINFADGTSTVATAASASEITLDAVPHIWTDLTFNFAVPNDNTISSIDFMGTGYEIVVDGEIVTQPEKDKLITIPTEADLANVEVTAIGETFNMKDIDLTCVAAPTVLDAAGETVSFDDTGIWGGASAVEGNGNEFVHVGTRAYNHSSVSIETGVALKAGTAYKMSFKFSNDSIKAANMYAVIVGAGTDGADLKPEFAPVATTAWRTYTVEFTPATDTTGTVKFSGRDPRDKMGFGIDDLVISEIVTDVETSETTETPIVSISDWSDVTVSGGLTVMTEVDYLAIAAPEIEGATTVSASCVDVIKVASGVYTITGNFRTPNADRLDTVNNAGKGRALLADYNGVDVVANVTFADGSVITVPANDAAADTVDTKAVEWTKLTFEFPVEADTTITNIEFVATGYDVVVDGTVVTASKTIPEVASAADLANVQLTPVAKTFNMQNVALTCTSVPAVIENVGDSVAITEFEGASAVEGDGNEFIHVGTRSLNSTAVSIDTGVEFKAGTAYTMSFKLSNDANKTALRAIIMGIGAEGANVQNNFDAVATTAWRTYTVEFTPETDATGKVNFSGQAAREKMGFGIDDLVITETATGTELVSISDWSDVTFTGAAVMTEVDYLAIAAPETEGATSITVSNADAIKVVPGAYTITGDFRVRTADRSNTVNLADGGKLLRDYNGVDVVAKVTLADGNVITVPANDAAADTVDTKAAVWTELTFEFPVTNATTITNIEFVATGYNVVVDGTVVSFTSNLNRVASEADLANVQLTAVAKAFNMKGVKIACTDIPEVIEEIGDSLPLDNFDTATAVEGTGNEFVHVGTRNLNSTAVSIETGVAFKAGTEYSMSFKFMNDSSAMNMRAIIAGIGAEGANVECAFDAAKGTNTYTVTFIPETEATGKVSISGVAGAKNKMGFGIDDLVITETASATTVANITDWSDVTVSGLTVMTDTDYLAVAAPETEGATSITVSNADAIKVVPGAYTITGNFRVPTADRMDVVNNAGSGYALLRDFNGVDVVANVTFADGSVITVPATGAAADTVDTKAVEWTELTFEFPVTNATTITNIEFVATGYDVFVDGTVVTTKSSVCVVQTAADLEKVQLTPVAKAFDMQNVAITLASSALVALEKVGDSVALDNAIGAWAGKADVTKTANEYLHFDQKDTNSQQDHIFTGVTFEVGTVYKLSFDYRNEASMDTLLYIKGVGAEGANLKEEWGGANSRNWATKEITFTAESAGDGDFWYQGNGRNQVKAWDFDNVVITVVTPALGSTLTADQILFSTNEAHANETYYVDWNDVTVSERGVVLNEVTEYMTSAAEDEEADLNKASFETTDYITLAEGFYKFTGEFRVTKTSIAKILTYLNNSGINYTYVNFNGVDLVAKVSFLDGTTIEVPAKFALDYTLDAGGYVFTDVDFVFEVEDTACVTGVEFVGTGLEIVQDGTIVYNKSGMKTFDPAVYTLDDVKKNETEEQFDFTNVALTCISEAEANAKYECDAHVNAPTVKENEVAGTCQTVGSYDNVVYCQICGEEVSRKTVTEEELGDHNYVDNFCEYCGQRNPNATFVIAGLGDSIALDYFDTATAVEGTGNEFIHVGTRNTNSTAVSVETGAALKAGTAYTMSFKFSNDANKTSMRAIIAGIGAEGANVTKTFDPVATTAWRTYSVEFTPETDATGKVSFSGYSGPKDKMGFGIDDLVITETATGTELVSISDWSDVTFTGAAVMTEVDYLTIAAPETEGATTVSTAWADDITVVAGAYKITGNFRVPNADRNDTVNDSSNGRALLRDYNGVDVVAKVTLADGSVITVPATGAAADTVDTKAVEWTELTFEFPVENDTAITNIEFVATGYDVVVDGTVVTLDKSIPVVASADALANVQLTPVAKTFNMKDVKITLDVVTDALKNVGDSLALDNFDTASAVEGTGNEFIHVGTRYNNSTAVSVETGAAFKAGTAYTMSFKFSNDANKTSMRAIIAGIGADGANETKTFDPVATTAWRTYSVEFTAETDATGKVSFSGYSGPKDKMGFGIDDLVITETATGTEIVSISDWSDVTFTGAAVMTEVDYLTIAAPEAEGATTVSTAWADTILVVAGTHKITGDFRTPNADRMDTVNDSSDKYALLADFNGVDVVANVTFADGSVITVPATGAAADTVDTKAVEWTELTFEFSVEADTTITNIEFVAAGYDVFVDGTVVTTDKSIPVVASADALANVQLTPVAKAFNMKDIAIECVSVGEVEEPGCQHVNKNEAVVENEIPSTCTVAGSYDLVVYCADCGEEVSRQTVELELDDHIPNDAVIENVVEATCKVPASHDEVVYCLICNGEISRTTITGDLGDHTSGDAVIENVVEATCKVPASHDEVVYCLICGEEVSRTPVIGDLGDHNFVDGACTECGEADPSVGGGDDNVITDSITIDTSLSGKTGNGFANAVVTAPVGGWVKGENTFTVKADLVCRVYAKTADGEVKLLDATDNGDGTYSFTATLAEGSTILVAVAGDASGDGKLTNTDATRVKAHLGNKRALDDAGVLAADSSNDGRISNTDTTRIKAAVAGKRALDW